MPSSEFSLIETYFADIGKSDFPVRLPQGDDAAVLDIPRGMQAVMSIDTLIAGVHFPEQTSPADIAHKSLAVNLSDLAAMAAKPAWFLLSLSMPEIDENWLVEFSRTLRQVSQHYRIDLVGGDTCQGPLAVTIQVTGLAPEGRYVTRAGAHAGDLILVSGKLGNAALGLAHLQTRVQLPGPLRDSCLNALNRPTPRLDLNEFLANYASAAIDLSDGLIGDLGHILRSSEVGATVILQNLPVNNWLRENDAYDYALTGGDDYEICCTLPSQFRNRMDEWNRLNSARPLIEIGEITESGYTLIKDDHSIDLRNWRGYRHFS